MKMKSKSVISISVCKVRQLELLIQVAVLAAYLQGGGGDSPNTSDCAEAACSLQHCSVWLCCKRGAALQAV